MSFDYDHVAFGDVKLLSSRWHGDPFGSPATFHRKVSENMEYLRLCITFNEWLPQAQTTEFANIAQRWAQLESRAIQSPVKRFIKSQQRHNSVLTLVQDMDRLYVELQAAITNVMVALKRNQERALEEDRLHRELVEKYTSMPGPSRRGSSSKDAAPALETTSTDAAPRSSCLPGTVLEGLTWLKSQQPILAKPDEEYPPWLWTLLNPREDSKKGPAPIPGSPEAQKALRRANRKQIKGDNFMRAQ
ncbi:hypothetical protein FRB99_000942 [Tulasnella sp. 403]|nr:hypothetical protein FRB99_000942 [Tulasnella sp. 403]